MRVLAVFFAWLSVVSVAGAVPIVYNSQLQNGVPVLGTISQPNGNSSNPVGAEYYSFYATAGSPISISGDRLDGPYDMSFWVMSGIYNDTNDFGGSLPGGAAFFDFADDEAAPFIPGPFGDPRSVFVAPLTGYYTVAVTNFLSNGNPPYDFRLQANGVTLEPEPISIMVWGLAAGAGIVGYGLRRRKSVN